ncbi:protein kinase [Myxococcota bacterium]|nr:protein kinase [Myxococcota bacterium]
MAKQDEELGRASSGSEGSAPSSASPASSPLLAADLGYGTLAPTYSPSREGGTPMPGPIGAMPGAMLPPSQTAAGALATGPGGYSPVIPPAGAPGVVIPKTSSSSGSGGRSSQTANFGSIPPMFVGRVLSDRWEVGQRIGLGGMASVHEGMDHKLERAVAIKILHPHVAENPDSRERLAREARAIAQLKHENVIEVYDYAIDDPECTWLVSELIDGPSLRQILDRVEKPMPEVAVMIVTEIVRALRAAHAMGIVHRDVKPDNVLVGSSGRPKLSDFGIAQIVNEHRMTLTGNLVGSPSYMSPEQANGRRTDHRTDLFSIGIVLYRLVTGTLPFRGATAIETIRKVSIGEYTDPTEIEPGCAGAVAGIIRKSLATNIEERYQTADQLLHDLAIVLQDAGLSATWEELPKFFDDPSGYQAALRPRLARELEARGRALLEAGEEARAVDCFNRALSLGEGNQRTQDLVRELQKRRSHGGKVQRLVWATAMAVAAIAAISGVLLATDRLMSPSATEAPIAAEPREAPDPTAARPMDPSEGTEPAAQRADVVKTEAASADLAPPSGARPTDPKPTDTKAGGDGASSRHPIEAVEDPARDPSRDGRASKAVAARDPSKRSADGARAKKTPEPETPRSTIIAAGLPPTEQSPEPAASEGYGTLHVGTNVWADIWVDGKKLGRAPERSRYPLSPGVHQLRAVQPNCTPDEKEFTISAGETKRLRVTITCP